jgi:putative ABC transport system permease protein
MSDFRLPPLDAHERAYRVLLRLYPARFRRAFGQELVEAFRDARRDARRSGEPAGLFWLATLRDLLVHGCAERASSAWRTLRHPLRHAGGDSPMAAIPLALRLTELRHAARRLRRVPAFSIPTVLVLALGIGATTAMFSVVHAVLLSPLPFAQPERLVSLTYTLQVPGVPVADQSDASILLYQRHAKTLDVAAWRPWDLNIGADGGAPAERIAAAAVTASLFPVLGVQPVLGRAFREGEDRVGAPPIAILSHPLWMRRYGGDPTVIGRTIRVDGAAREIVGVMPEGFVYRSPRVQMLIPLPLDPANAEPGSFNNEGIGRLRDGATAEQARAELDAHFARILDEFPAPIPRAMWEEAKIRAVVAPLRDTVVGDVGRVLWIMLGSMGLVLAIACANVANLFLVRGESRQREFAVRGALGAGVAGVVAQCLGEALLLAGAGGALGVGLAALVVRIARTMGETFAVPRLHEVAVDTPVLLFALAVVAFCAACVSLIPVLRALHVPMATVLRDAGRASTEGRQRATARSALVVAQVALALVLVAASGLLARSFARIRDVEPGFAASGVTMARLSLPQADYPTAASALQLYDRLLERLRAVPGVRDATVTTWVPLGGDRNGTVMEVEDRPLPANGVPRVHFVVNVEASYFRTMGVPLLAGRSFGPQDAARPQQEAIVSRAFAERYWPGESALGRRVRRGLAGEWMTVVGVAGDAHFEALDRPAEDAVYFPLVGRADSSIYVSHYAGLMVRSEALSSAEVTNAIRRAVRELDPAMPTFDDGPLQAMVDRASARARFTLLLLGAASAIALALGAVGIYGVMAYGVSLRRREIGVRLALGARPADVRGMVSRQGVTLGAIGVAIGLVSALAAMRLLRGLLYDVSPTDPVTLVATCLTLLGVTLLATWLPARRAAATDPAVALRAD